MDKPSLFIYSGMYFRDVEHAFKAADFDYVIVDTDVGGDDCQALVTLFHLCQKDNKKLLGISCCNGNATIDDVVTNVLITQAVCGVSYPVYKGNDNSMGGENLKDFYFGKDGFGNRQAHYLEKLGDKIDRSLVQELKSYKFIAESAQKYKGKVALICLGPLSNLALAYHYNNEICGGLSNVVVMGGSDTLAGLNKHYAAEFNVGLDPEAGYVVFERFKNILLVDLDTSIIGIDQTKLRVLFEKDSSPSAELIHNVYKFMGQKNPPNPPLFCDPLAVLALFRPQCITSGMNIRLTVRTNGVRTRGSTIIDYFSPESQQHNCYLIKSFNLDVLVEETLLTYRLPQ